MLRHLDSEVRIAMMHAMEERKELEHELLGPDHLLLGLLSNVRGAAYKLLNEHGISYEWARRVVVEKHDDTPADERERGPVGAADNLHEDREALKAIGIDLDKVRDAVRETFGEDITDGWGERRGREGGRRRERGGHGPHGHGPRRHGKPGEAEPDSGPFGGEGFGGFGHGPFGPGGFGPGAFGPAGRGRRGPRSRRWNSVTPSMHRVLHEMRGAMRDMHGAGPCDERGSLTGALLLALFESQDPAVEAVIEAADDPEGLRAAVDALAGRAPR